MKQKIEAIKEELAGLQAQSADAIEQIRIKYLSKKGIIPSLMNDFRSVPAEQKRELGQMLNELKNLATERIAALKESLADNAEA